MGTAVEDPGTVGCQPKGLGDVFQGSGTCGADFRVGDVGADPLIGTGPGTLSTQGCKADNREKSEDTGGRGMGILTSGDSNGGGGL